MVDSDERIFDGLGQGNRREYKVLRWEDPSGGFVCWVAFALDVAGVDIEVPFLEKGVDEIIAEYGGDARAVVPALLRSVSYLKAARPAVGPRLVWVRTREV